MIKIFKDYLSEQEINKLNSLALSYLNTGLLYEGNCFGRFTTRHVNKQFKFEQFVYDIATKVRETAGVAKYPYALDRGVDGVNVAVTLSNGAINTHMDPRGPNEEICYRCNVITQKSEQGGELVMNGSVVELNVGDLHCYPASEVEHSVTGVSGKTPRIVWMFSSYIPKES